MDLTRLDDEHLEACWLIEEKGISGPAALKERLGEQYSPDIMEKLQDKGMIENQKLTESGKEYTGRLIRAHRLAERLLNDVLGLTNYEVGACEFEHIMNHEILDGLCTLLGHPTLCPHGLPIPPGECCRRGEKQVNQAVHSLSSLHAGEHLKILYIQTEKDRELHILEGMRIRPGKTVKVHQTHPSLVIENEGTHIAMDISVADKILGLSNDRIAEEILSPLQENGEFIPGWRRGRPGGRGGFGRSMGRGRMSPRGGRQSDRWNK